MLLKIWWCGWYFSFQRSISWPIWQPRHVAISVYPLFQYIGTPCSKKIQIIAPPDHNVHKTVTRCVYTGFYTPFADFSNTTIVFINISTDCKVVASEKMTFETISMLSFDSVVLFETCRPLELNSVDLQQHLHELDQYFLVKQPYDYIFCCSIFHCTGSWKSFKNSFESAFIFLIS